MQGDDLLGFGASGDGKNNADGTSTGAGAVPSVDGEAASTVDFLSGSPVKNRAVHNMNSIGIDNAGAGAGAGDDNLLGFAQPAPQLLDAQLGTQPASNTNNLLDFAAPGGEQQNETETTGIASDLFAPVVAGPVVAADPFAPQPPQHQSQALQPPADPFGQDIFQPQHQPLEPPPPQADPFTPVVAATPDSVAVDPFAPANATQDPFVGGFAATSLSGTSSVTSAPPAIGIMASTSMTSQDTMDSSIAMQSLPNPEPSYSNPLMTIPSPAMGTERPVASFATSLGDDFQSMATAPLPLLNQSEKQENQSPFQAMTNNSPPKEQEIIEGPGVPDVEPSVAPRESNGNKEVVETGGAPPLSSGSTSAAPRDLVTKEETRAQTQPATSPETLTNRQSTSTLQDEVNPQLTNIEAKGEKGEASVETTRESIVSTEMPPGSQSPVAPFESPGSGEKAESAPGTAESVDGACIQTEDETPKDTQPAAIATDTLSELKPMKEAEKPEETIVNDSKGDSAVKAENEMKRSDNTSKAKMTDNDEQPPKLSIEDNQGISEPAASSTQGSKEPPAQDGDGEAAPPTKEGDKAPVPDEPEVENVSPVTGTVAATVEPSNNDKAKPENDAETSDDGGKPPDVASEPDPAQNNGPIVESTVAADRGESQEEHVEPVSWLAAAKVNGEAHIPNELQTGKEEEAENQAKENQIETAQSQVPEPVQNELQNGKEEEAKEQVEENQTETAQPQVPRSSETQQGSSVERSLPDLHESDEPTDQEILASLAGKESSTEPVPKPAVPGSSKDKDNALLAERAASLEKQLAAAEALIAELQYTEAESKHENDSMLAELQANLQKQMTLRAEAENSARRATEKATTVGEEFAIYKKETTFQLESLTDDLAKAMKSNASMKKELDQIRSERNEQARNEASLTTRLNAAKKKEGEIGYAAEVFEKRTDQLQTELTRTTEKLTSVTADRDCLKKDVANWKQFAEEKTQKLDSALKSERRHNDERKKKMKLFVEQKTEEVRLAKADHLSLQTELDQTNQSLKELNQRFKQLHVQWVESQTRCRELQRDITKMKKDSEKMSKVGGTLEAKLSRSAMETEDHKNKRLAAKNELMALLRQLEAEKEISNRLRDSMKVTFTTKALSQQQTMSDALDAFEGALQRLALRLNRTVPARNATGSSSNEQQASDDGSNSHHSSNLQLGFSDASTSLVLNKLETETQRVSDYVVAFVENVDRMNVLVDGAGSGGCVGALQKILVPGRRSQISSSEERSGLRISRGPRYGQIPANSDLT